MNVSKKTAFVAIILIAIAAISGFVAGVSMSYPVGYNEGAIVGYNHALADVANLLQQKGITLDWYTNTDGSYTLKVITSSGISTEARVAVNLLVEWRDSFGRLKETGHGAGTFTNIGKNWTVQQIGNFAGCLGQTGVNATTYAQYLGNGNNASNLVATDEYLKSEWNSNGLARAAATTIPYWTALGQFACNKTFTVTTASSTVNSWGLYYGAFSATDASINSTLISWDVGPGTKNTLVGDTLTESWTVTVS